MTRQNEELITAAVRNHLPQLRELLQAGASANLCEPDGTPLLHHAIHHGNTDMLRELLAHGASPDSTNSSDTTALLFAATLRGRSFQMLHRGYSPKEALPPAFPHWLEAAKVLLLAGADANRANDGNYSPLLLATRYGDEELAQLLVQHGATEPTPPAGGRMETEFWQDELDWHVFCAYREDIISAAWRHDILWMRQLLDSGADINTRHLGYDSALSIATSEGDTDMAAFLLEQGADANIHDEVEGSLLHILACHRARALREHGNALNAEEEEPLFTRWFTCAQLLLQAGAETDAGDNEGETALHACVRSNDISFIELLLKHGASTEVQEDIAERTPLQLATHCGRQEAADLLRQHQEAPIPAPEPPRPTAPQEAPTISAASSHHLGQLRDALAAGEDINAQSQQSGPDSPGGESALVLAATHAHTAMVRLLLEAGADVNLPDHGQRTPLLAVAGQRAFALLMQAEKPERPAADSPLFHAWLDIAGLLLSQGADANAADKLGNTPLLLASSYEDHALAQLLLRCGATPLPEAEAAPEAREASRRRLRQLLICSHRELITTAAEKDNADWLRELVAQGEDVNAEDFWQLTPLVHAALNGNEDMVRFLLAHGARLDTEDLEGRGILHLLALAHAEHAGRDSLDGRLLEIALLLIEAGADVNHADYGDETALYAAAGNGDTDFATLLLEHGAASSLELAECSSGWTPLHVAAAWLREPMVTLLLSYGANARHQDKQGRRADDHAPHFFF